MSLENLTLLTKLEELDTYSHKALIQFPKYEKFVLCAEIRQTLTAIIRLYNDKKYLKRNNFEETINANRNKHTTPRYPRSGGP